MNSILKFFIENSRFNYTLLLFTIFIGFMSYKFLPKDVFPPIQLDKIIITGGYPGSSVDILDKMAVTKLEDELRSLSGISKMESNIKNSSFMVTLTLERGADIDKALNDSKDIISNVKRYFPNDMDEPVTQIAELDIPVIAVVVSSDTEKMDDLIKYGKDIKKEITKIEGVSKVNLYLENDRSIEISIDSKRVEMFGINKTLLINQLQKFSYIYPSGKVEETGNHLFISTLNGAINVEEILNTNIVVGNKEVKLKDIATVESKYKSVDIITRFNGDRDVEMGVFKNESGDAIALAESIKKKIEELNIKYPTLKIDTYNDASKIVRERLNTVFSNIFFGIILIFFSVWFLINKKMAFVVTIGIPTALLMGALAIYLLDYSINIITLLGVLLIIGVLVDDAVIVAENIQRHIKNGEDPIHSTIIGTREVLIPVIASSITTVFAFMPMFVLTGEMGEFLKMIPIAVIVLVFASLLESFVFLPIHSLHIFNKDDKERDWSFVNNIYKNILRFFVINGKTTVPLFIISISILTVISFQHIKYQLFPDFDSDKMFVRGTFLVNHTVDEVANKLQKVEKILLNKSDELKIKSISLLTGYKNATLGMADVKPNVFEFFIELKSRKPQNFFDKYINPYLSPRYDGSGQEREIDVGEIVERVKKIFSEVKLEGLEELLIIRDKPAVTKYDVEILLNTADINKLNNALSKLKSKLSQTAGVTTFGDDAKKGILELKIRPNRYGESLGFSETLLSSAISPFFLETEQSRGLGNEGIVQIITKEKNLNKAEILYNFQLSTPDGKSFIALRDVAEFSTIQNFDSIFKENGVAVKTVFANVNNINITAVELLEKLQPLFDEISATGVEIELKGEQEQNKRLMVELGLAFIVAIFLIFITLLIEFNSFSNVILILSVIPLSVLGAVVGHFIVGMNFAMPSVIGILGLAGVVINNGIVVLEFIRYSNSFEEMLDQASLRFRPIIITSFTTFIGLISLIFWATGQALILQPIAVSLGFGLIWGTILNLFYLPAIYATIHRTRFFSEHKTIISIKIIEKRD